MDIVNTKTALLRVVVCLFLIIFASATLNLEEYDVEKYEHSRVRRAKKITNHDYSVIKKVDKFTSGSFFIVNGISKRGSQSFRIRFMETEDPNGAIALYLAVRFDTGHLVCNFKEANASWPMDQQQHIVNPIKLDKQFKILVQGFTRYFRVFVDDKLVLTYLARLPLSLVKFISVEGDIRPTNDIEGLRSMKINPMIYYTFQHRLKMGKTFRVSGYSTGNQFKIELASTNETTFFSVEVIYDKREIIFTRPLKHNYKQIKTRFIVYSGEASIPFKENACFDMDIVNTKTALLIYYNDRTVMKFPQVNSPFGEPNPEHDYIFFRYSGDLHMTFARFNYESGTTLDQTYNWF